ncbi:MAG: hypothetical protein NNA31_03265 [Nitrospira sp.]|nr:hypothetical protein [Nitrospira sp.]
MSFLSEAATVAFRETGLQPLGIGMPFISKKWCSHGAADAGGHITFNAESLSLTLSGGETWYCPISARVVKTNVSDRKPTATLIKTDGTAVNGDGLLFELFPGALQRLKRLYVRRLEAASPVNYPNKPVDRPIRPVPRYFFIASSDVGEAVTGGWLHAGQDTGIAGELFFFDEQGHIIHPLMVASCFTVLADAYAGLVKESAPNQLAHIVGLSPGSFTVRTVKPDGTPYDGAFVNGKTDMIPAIGLFTVSAYTGSDAELKGELTRQPDTGATGAFPLERARHLHLGLDTFGRLGNRCALPALPSGTTLTHDFFTIKVLDTRTYLTGAPDRSPTGYVGSRLEPAPAVRLHEDLKTLADGNALMQRLHSLFNGSATESLVAAAEIDPKFPLPSGTDIYWPSFPPPTGSSAPADDDPFPSDFKRQVIAASRAVVIDGSSPDVCLTLVGLPVDCAVRVYHRVFGSGAVLSRGDGAGGLANSVAVPTAGRTFNGQCVLRLANPLGLEPPFSFPPSPKLIFDMVVVQRSGRVRIFGNLELPVNTTPEAGPADPADNVVATAAKQGVCRAGVLGLRRTSAPLPAITDLNSLLNAIVQLGGEDPPRDAPRLPTMARRDLSAAAKRGADWTAVLAGGAIGSAMHSAQSTLGAPGSQGGPETQYVGVFTQNAGLAYDVARMTFRRTTSFYDRIQQLNNSLWDEPVPNTPLDRGQSPDGTRGTIAGAVLQTIAPYCETPELALLKSVVEANIASIPRDWNALVDLVVSWIDGLNLSGLPSPLDAAGARLKTELRNRLNSLKDSDPAHESQRERLYTELVRELSAACFGRRDAQWALEEAIKNARRFIYLETPGLSFTEAGAARPYSRNLKSLLAARISSHPGLKVVICVPKVPDYGKGYEQYRAKEVKDRFDLVLDLPSANVVSFHPVGFPGRPSRLESQVVIVDDEWAMVGSSSFRRRGLTFDGGSDLVWTDLERSDGAAPSIASFRKMLMAARLGITGNGFDSRRLMLEDVADVFHFIRETLRDGGLGRIEPLWNGRTDGVTYSEPTLDSNLVNPEGVEFQTLNALVFAALGSVPL